MALASAVLYQAFRKIGQLRPGYTAPPELLADGLIEWANFFDECGAERNTHFSNPYYQHTITGPGSQTLGNGYLIGPTATTAAATATTAAGGANDWNQPRPVSILGANLVLTNGAQPIYIPMTPLSQEDWMELSVQQIPAISIATAFWYDPQWPNGVFNVFPPLNGNAVQIYQWGVLTPPTLLTDPYTAPPGYADFVIYGLAERLYYMVQNANMCPRMAPYSLIAGQALIARQTIKLVNRDIPRLATDYPRSPNSGDGFFDRDVSYTGEPY